MTSFVRNQLCFWELLEWFAVGYCPAGRTLLLSHADTARPTTASEHEFFIPILCSQNGKADRCWEAGGLLGHPLGMGPPQVTTGLWHSASRLLDCTDDHKAKGSGGWEVLAMNGSQAEVALLVLGLWAVGARLLECLGRPLQGL